MADRIGDYSKAHLLKHANSLVEERVKVTTVFSEHAEAKIPKFDASELNVGQVLGRGGFCVVSEIQKITLQDDNKNNTTTEIVQNRQFMSDYCIREGNHARYALKKLSPESLQDSDLFCKGTVDLLLEAKFLAVIRHAHIVKMRAMSTSTTNVFLVLDRLYETFEQKLGEWNRQGKSSVCPCFSAENNVWGDKLVMAHDLASAFKYLHGIDIVYRDLKPDNIRFDVRGDVKLFDFGLAREMSHLTPNPADGLYTMTGDTGSIIYMAPEVALSKPYNETVDVYSFGILLWQICKGAMHVYEGFNYNMIINSVVKGGARPAMDKSWSVELQQLINKCWSKDISRRPSMEQVMEALYDEMRLSDAQQEDDDVMDVSMKSMHSLHLKKERERK